MNDSPDERERRAPSPAAGQMLHGSSPRDGEVLRLLLIEDNRVDACVTREYLASADGVIVELEHVDRLSTGLSRLKDKRFHAAVIDLNLPDSEGADTVVRTHACDPSVPIVVLTGVEEKAVALQAVRAGAEDYLCKNELEPKLLLRSIRYAIERAAHRQADEQFRDEEVRYRRLLEAVTSYTYSVTFAEGGSFTRHGLGCLATTGYSPDEYATDPYLWISIVHPDDREMVRQYVAGILAGEKLPPIEHRILHKDGSTRWIRDTIIHRCDEGGRLSGYDGVVEDISQRKQATEALRASEDSLHARESHLLAAGAIQARLLPTASPALPGFDIAGAVYPAEFTAGDYFDYVPMADGSLGLIIADVAGHGLGPGMIMALTYAHVRSLAKSHEEPGEILTQVNRFLVDECDPFVTLLFARSAPSARSLTWINAGHPPGVVLDSADHVKVCLESTTLPLAVTADTAFSPHDAVTLEPGDIVLLLTDGILEARSATDAAFGMRRALDVVAANRSRSAGKIVAAVHRAVQEFCCPKKPVDDITAIVIKVGPEAEA